MKNRTTAVMAVAVVAIVLVYSYVGLAGSDDDLLGEPWTDSCLEGNLPGHHPSPADDLYAWANYDWLRDTELPFGMDFASDQIDMMLDAASRIISAIDRDGDTREDRVLGTMLSLIEDRDTRESAGNQPLARWLDEVESIGTTEEMIDYLVGGDMLWRFDFDPGYMRSEDGGSIVLVEFAPRFWNYPGYDFVPLIGDLLQACGVADAYGKAEAILPLAEFSDYDSYETTVGDLLSDEGGWPTGRILVGMGFAPGDRVVVSNSGLADELGRLLHEDLDTLKAYIETCYSIFAGPFLDMNVLEAYTASSALTLDASFITWDDALTVFQMSRAAPYLTASLYSDRCFDDGFRESVEEATGFIVDSYRSMLLGCGWLDGPTRDVALEKLDGMLFVVAEITWARDMEPWEFSTKNLLEYASDCRLFEQSLYHAALDRPYDPTSMFHSSVCEANLFYEPELNTVYMGGPYIEFLGGDRSFEDLLAGTGFAIAHEISHGFDTYGRWYDPLGWPDDWWTPGDMEEFESRTGAIADRLSSFEPQPGLFFDGYALLGEAVADVSAMTCVLGIAGQTEGFDYEGFFEAFAESMRMKYNLRGLMYMTGDEHLISCYRINFLAQNFREFHDAFGVKGGDGMWLPPEDYLRVW